MKDMWNKDWIREGLTSYLRGWLHLMKKRKKVMTVKRVMIMNNLNLSCFPIFSLFNGILSNFDSSLNC